MDEKIIRSIGTKRPCREKCTPPGKKPKLNENQQVVLEWLKDDFKESGNPVDSLESLASEVLHVETFQTCISSTYDELSISEQFQVLQAFAEWGKEKVMK